MSALPVKLQNDEVKLSCSGNPGGSSRTLFALLPSTDIKERFTNCVLLLIVCLRNMEQFSWNPGKSRRSAPLPSTPSTLIRRRCCTFRPPVGAVPRCHDGAGFRGGRGCCQARLHHQVQRHQRRRESFSAAASSRNIRLW